MYGCGLLPWQQDIGRNEKGKLETLTTENKQLLRQRNELMTAFKKQLKLIDILKKQKVSLLLSLLPLSLPTLFHSLSLSLSSDAY